MSAASTPRKALWLFAIIGNTITSGSILTFPLFFPPLSRSLGLSSSQTSIIASACSFGVYLTAVFWGMIGDRASGSGPGIVSGIAGVLFGVGYLGMYVVTTTPSSSGANGPAFLWLCLFYSLVGAATSASYFAAIISASKSAPARYAGSAIGFPCALYGLSPLFLTQLAAFFTIPSPAEGVPPELDARKWLLFLSIMLFTVNTLSALGLQVISFEDKAAELAADSEQSRLLPADEEVAIAETSSEPISSLLCRPSFYLFGFSMLLSVGPLELVLVHIGSIIQSLVAEQEMPAPVGQGVIAMGAGLALRRKHVQIIAVFNTGSRLIVGAASDFLSQPAAQPEDDGSLVLPKAPLRFSRLVCLILVCFILTLAFGYTALGIDISTLSVLSVSTGLCYGSIFSLSPVIIRNAFGQDDFGRNFGLIFWFSAAGALIATPAYGFFADRVAAVHGSEICEAGRECFSEVFLISSVSCLVAGLLCTILWTGAWRNKV